MEFRWVKSQKTPHTDTRHTYLFWLKAKGWSHTKSITSSLSKVPRVAYVEPLSENRSDGDLDCGDWVLRVQLVLFFPKMASKLSPLRRDSRVQAAVGHFESDTTGWTQRRFHEMLVLTPTTKPFKPPSALVFQGRATPTQGTQVRGCAMKKEIAAPKCDGEKCATWFGHRPARPQGRQAAKAGRHPRPASTECSPTDKEMHNLNRCPGQGQAQRVEILLFRFEAEGASGQ